MCELLARRTLPRLPASRHAAEGPARPAIPRGGAKAQRDHDAPQARTPRGAARANSNKTPNDAGNAAAFVGPPSFSSLPGARRSLRTPETCSSGARGASARGSTGAVTSQAHRIDGVPEAWLRPRRCGSVVAAGLGRASPCAARRAAHAGDPLHVPSCARGARRGPSARWPDSLPVKRGLGG
eukprot:15452993-Alexandrium_andersonii.AAC.1